ncbi:hypothetical protein PF002_g10486 [Phytophthora fragariae]|uniref:Uncharacterized protein n=1 Tax=Phytophthora fragariae TaxID=53985 RepID=A0A6A3ZR19_9STRA|nr:hypothetical protein PF004_g9908 [Phytophthora fragariae]KAE9239003.1 hypothetical protein PF002_g10486 [Phytophthora fragariae]
MRGVDRFDSRWDMVELASSSRSPLASHHQRKKWLRSPVAPGTLPRRTTRHRDACLSPITAALNRHNYGDRLQEDGLTNLYRLLEDASPSGCCP